MPYNNIISRSDLAAVQKAPQPRKSSKKGGPMSPIVTLLEGKKGGGKK